MFLKCLYFSILLDNNYLFLKQD